MSIALDASSPVRFSVAANTNGSPFTSGAFTAPSGAFLVVCVEADGTNAWTMVTSDTGGLTWTKQVERNTTEATAGGYAGIFTATTVSSVSRTISVTGTGGASLRITAQCYVYTGVDTGGTPVDTVTASNEGGSATVNFTTTSLTPGATGVIVAAGCEWNAKGACTSSDLRGVDSVVGSGHAEYAGAIDVIDGWHTVTSGVGATANLTAFAATPQWKWCQIIVREPAGGATAWGPLLGLGNNRLVVPCS